MRESNGSPSRVRLSLLFLVLFAGVCAWNLYAAELPLVRIAHGAFSEEIAVLWVGAEQGLFRKHGVNVEVINIRSGPQTMAAVVSGDIQIAYTIPGSVVSAAASGLDVAFFAGLINKADGDFIAHPSIRSAEDLKGKRIGVQSIGGGVWSMAMLAIEHLGLETTRDKMTVMIVGDSPVLAQSLEQGGIDATYLNYTHSRSLKEKRLHGDARPRQGGDSVSGARRRHAVQLSQTTCASHRFVDARLCRERQLHSPPGESRDGDQVTDEKPALEEQPRR